MPYEVEHDPDPLQMRNFAQHRLTAPNETGGANREVGGGGTLRIIAGFKVMEALILVLAGFGALGMLDPDLHRTAVGWLESLSLHEGRHLSSALADKAATLLGATSFRRLELVAVGCFLYAAVFLVEATGLWLRKTWAEYLTTIITASLLPFEIVELAKHASAAKVATLAVNVLVLVYLIVRLVKQHREAKAR